MDHHEIQPLHFPGMSNPEGIQHLEVHWSIVPPDSPFDIHMEEIWERVRRVELKGTAVSILAPEDMLLHLCLHAFYQHGLTYEGLRSCCDITAAIHHYKHELDWNQVQIRARNWGGDKYLYLALRLSQEMLSTTLHGRLMQALKPSPFNERIVLEAKERILDLEVKTPLPAAMRYPAKIQIFNSGTGLREKACFFLKRILIPSEELAQRYALPPSAKRVYIYYVARILRLVFSYARVYAPYLCYKLVHKKPRHCNYNLDLWLAHPGSPLLPATQRTLSGKRCNITKPDSRFAAP